MGHTYTITINKKSRSTNAYTYSYGNTRNIRMALTKNGVSICFEMSVLKTADDFAELKVNLFRDALRKAYLLHAVVFDSSLIIKNIVLEIDGIVTVFDEKTLHFPFVFSMMASPTLGLGKICGHSGIINAILTETKTSSAWDEKYCALYAYMMSKTRLYEVDRFLNLWTSMNSLYNMIARQFEDNINKECQESSLIYPSKYKIHSIDNPSLGALICLIHPKTILPKKPDNRPEYKAAYRNVSRLVKDCGVLDLHALYTASLLEMTQSKRDAQYIKLYELADSLGLPLYIFFLLVYPYWLRCNYFHGSKTQPILAAYTDSEYRDLKLVNTFLVFFLEDSIPKMFAGQCLTKDETEQIKQYLKLREK